MTVIFPMLHSDHRRRFDGLLDEVLAELPDELHELMEEIPLIVEDEPSRQLLDQMKLNARTTDLCGLHWGVPLTRRSVEHSGRLPDQMSLFRGPIMRVAGRKHGELREQIRITLLHEIGHHFGLDEGDLQRLGYG
jgi:predicted Zn-dependent protease with MMP-like domain